MTQPAASGSSDLPVVVDALTAELLRLFAIAEQDLLIRFSTLTQARGRIALIVALRREALRVIADLRPRIDPLTQRVTLAAASDAARDAARELAGIPPTSLPPIPGGAGPGDPGRHRIDLLGSLPPARRNPIGDDLATRLEATLPRFVRFADDAYRASVLDTAGPILSGVGTQQLSQAAAWRQLTEQGITGFVDSRGRRWNLSSYVEMATRTAVQRAYNAAHIERMAAAGITQFTVPSDGHPCPLCRPWQGQVLTLDGASPTIAEATAAGLFHPNCRHTLVPYLPGRTTLAPAGEWTEDDARRYAATQQLRAMERQVRAHRRAAAAALTPLEQRRAAARARAAQARIREHVTKHGLVRRRRREEIDLGNR